MQKINIMTREGTTNNAPVKGKPSISVSPNPKRTSVFLDVDGNEIDRRTKKILKPNNDK